MRGVYRRLLGKGSSHRAIFTDLYLSGADPSTWPNSDARERFIELAASIGVESVIDAGCGVFGWASDLNGEGVKVTGIDIVGEIVSANASLFPTVIFRQSDITRDPTPQADLIICRDVLVYFSFRSALRTLRNFIRSGSTYLLATNHDVVEENEDQPTGYWRPLNLLKPPFSFPKPWMVIPDPSPNDRRKMLALWSIDELAKLGVAAGPPPSGDAEDPARLTPSE